MKFRDFFRGNFVQQKGSAKRRLLEKFEGNFPNEFRGEFGRGFFGGFVLAFFLGKNRRKNPPQIHGKIQIRQNPHCKNLLLL